MELRTLDRGRSYSHKTLGEVVLLGSHPHDGACLIIERYDPEEDEWSLHRCEASDFVEYIPNELHDAFADEIKKAVSR